MNIKRLKQTTLGLGVSLALLTACNQSNTTAQEAESKLEDHIATIEAKAEENAEWLKEHWEEVEENYQEMKKDVKNSEVVEKMDRRWDIVVAKVKTEETDIRYTPIVMQAYEALGISDQEVSMSFVTKANILSKYKAFVTTVEANKKSYDTNDWADLEVVWDALNKRKNELEPLESSDNLEIAELKIKYAGMKTVRKTEAKVEDKLDNEQYK